MKYEWRESNGQSYLYVDAENRTELGVGVGSGLVKQINAMRIHIKGVENNLQKNRPERFDSYKILMKKYTDLIPDEDKSELEGIQAGFNKVSEVKISMEEIYKQSIYLDVVYQVLSRLKNGETFEGCTNFGAVNTDCTIIHGQNYDTDLKMMPTYAFVHHRLPNEPEVFVFRKGSDLGTATAKNSEGVLITVSVVDSNITADVITPRGILVRNALRMDNAYDAMNAMTDELGRTPFAYNLVISDNQRVIASQAIPSEARITVVKDYIVQSNQYDYHDWIKYMKKPSYSKIRQHYAQRLMRDFYSVYGKITEEDLLEILGDEPVILRCNEGQSIGSTVLFITRNSFGLGSVKNGIGIMPI